MSKSIELLLSKIIEKWIKNKIVVLNNLENKAL